MLIPYVTENLDLESSQSLGVGSILNQIFNNVRYNGGGGGIRTHDTFITYTRFPSVLLRPTRTLLRKRLLLNSSSVGFWFLNLDSN